MRLESDASGKLDRVTASELPATFQARLPATATQRGCHRRSGGRENGELWGRW